MKPIYTAADHARALARAKARPTIDPAHQEAIASRLAHPEPEDSREPQAAPVVEYHRPRAT